MRYNRNRGINSRICISMEKEKREEIKIMNISMYRDIKPFVFQERDLRLSQIQASPVTDD